MGEICDLYIFGYLDLPSLINITLTPNCSDLKIMLGKSLKQRTNMTVCLVVNLSEFAYCFG
jgi:hypothetical protein